MSNDIRYKPKPRKPHPPAARTEFRVMYQRFDYRAMYYTSDPVVMYRFEDADQAADRLQVEVSASGAPEEWWVDKVTTERLET